ncbi:MAG TPA: hypothetical protein ENH26_02225 [Candidatus Wolfebacteria bacterium]|nr:hypothetical protein [Candidatus Wolfebacteria bacterium]
MHNNNQILFKVLVLFVIFGLFGIFSYHAVRGADSDELKYSIEQKSLELQEINNQIEQTQEELEQTQEEGKTLKKQISRINSQVNQLKLGIRSSEVMIGKLGLEVESLQYDIIDTEERIIINREAIAEILRQLQQQEEETALMVFLRNKSLADGIFEIQNLANLNDKLSVEVANLGGSKIKLDYALNDAANKKQLTKAENFNLKNKKEIVEEVKKDKQIILSQTKNQEYLYQKQLKELDTLQEEIAKEVFGFEEELRLKINPTALPTPRPGILKIPVPIPPARLTQKYGKTSYVLRMGRSWHNGIDLGAPMGTPIFSAEKGEVIAVGNQDNYRTNGKKLCRRGAYGKFVVIKHENNLTTFYAHLSRWVVKIGDKVERGQNIGYVGSTGRSTGPHLHFVVYSSQTIPPATPGFPEGTRSSRVCGPMPVGGDLNPLSYLNL